MVIGCGAALRFLQIATRHFGRELHIEYFPQGISGHYLARVELGVHRASTSDDDALFQALKDRHTNRGVYKPADLAPGLLENLAAEAHHQGVWLRFVTETAQREQLVSVISRGDLDQWADGPFKKEMADWIRAGNSKQQDGMPVTNMGYNDIEQRILPIAMRQPLIAGMVRLDDLQADKSWLLAGGAPVLAVMGTVGAQDSPRDWLAVGEAIGGVLLLAGSQGVAASFFNSPVHVHHLWTQVFRIINYQGFIHLIFRLGYPTEAAPTAPRRPVSEVLLRAGAGLPFKE